MHMLHIGKSMAVRMSQEAGEFTIVIGMILAYFFHSFIPTQKGGLRVPFDLTGQVRSGIYVNNRFCVRNWYTDLCGRRSGFWV